MTKKNWNHMKSINSIFGTGNVANETGRCVSATRSGIYVYEIKAGRILESYYVKHYLKSINEIRKYVKDAFYKRNDFKDEGVL